MQFRIWRSAVAPSVAAERAQYGCTTTVPHVHNSPKIFRKIYFLHDFRCTQTCSFQAIFGLPVRTLTIAVSATSCPCRAKMLIFGLWVNPHTGRLPFRDILSVNKQQTYTGAARHGVSGAAYCLAGAHRHGETQGAANDANQRQQHFQYNRHNCTLHTCRKPKQTATLKLLSMNDVSDQIISDNCSLIKVDKPQPDKHIKQW